MTDTNDTKQELQAAPRPERGFHTGEHVILRPVLEADLPELAKLLAENPYDRDPQPWTHQRLKKQFEDKEDPGLWKDRERYFAIVRKEGGLIGFLFEEDNWGLGGLYWNRFHIGAALPDRDALGRDVLQTYFAYKQRWHNPLRLCFSIADVEEQKAQWLTDAGYELEVALPHAVLYQGRPAAEQVFSWIGPYLRGLAANDGPVAGEELESVPSGAADAAPAFGMPQAL